MEITQTLTINGTRQDYLLAKKILKKMGILSVIPKKQLKIGINNPKHPYYNKLTPQEEVSVQRSLKEIKAGKLKTYTNIDELMKGLNSK